MDAVEMLRWQGGVGRWSDLVGSARAARELDRHVQAGRVVRLAPGAYALPGADPALVAACIHRAHATCATAALLHGLTVLQPPPLPHLSVPRSRGRTWSQQRQPWPAVLHRADGSELPDGRAPVAAIADALARMLTCSPPGPALVTIDSALARRLTTVEQIAARVRGPRRVRALLTLRQADGRSQSPTETLARLVLVGAGFAVEPAARVSGVGWVDLLVEGRIVVELDGFAYHSGRAEYREDRRRDRELARQGFIVLRFTFEDVIRDPQIVVRAVLAVLTDPHSRTSGARG
jgi:very-short-patch-repair endonuclease